MLVHHDGAFSFYIVLLYLPSWWASVLRINRHFRGGGIDSVDLGVMPYCHSVTFSIQEALNSSTLHNSQDNMRGDLSQHFCRTESPPAPAGLALYFSSSRQTLILLLLEPSLATSSARKQPTEIFSWCATFRLGSSQSSIRTFLIN